MDAPANLRLVRTDEHPRFADLLVRAFEADPFHGWLFPDGVRRPERQRRLFRKVLDMYGRQGTVLTTLDEAGVALWDPPRDRGPTLLETLEFVLRVLPIFGIRALQVTRGMAPLAGLHPDEPHWYLAILATDPDRQRSGVGAALLTPILRRCDADATPACLEASCEVNIPYYERFGFEVVAPLRMPSGPSLYRMMRPARPGRVRDWVDGGPI